MNTTKELCHKDEHVDLPETLEEWIWDCDIDIGYAVIRVISPDVAFRISSDIYKLSSDDMPTIDVGPRNIVYRDRNGEWAVGDLAYSLKKCSMQEASDISKNSNKLLCSDPEYRIYFSVAMGLALLPILADEDDHKIIKKFVELGEYPEMGDASLMKSVLTGKYDFDLKFGKTDFVHFDFEITPEQLIILEMPRSITVPDVD